MRGFRKISFKTIGKHPFPWRIWLCIWLFSGWSMFFTGSGAFFGEHSMWPGIAAQEKQAPEIKTGPEGAGGKKKQNKPDDAVHFQHKILTGFRLAESRVAGLPSEDLFEWRIIFQKYFRPVYSTDLVDHESSLVNPYYIDVNYRNRRIPRNVEINQGDQTNFNIEVNRAAFNFLGYADNRGFLAGMGVAVENVFPFRSSDKHFIGLHPMMRLTDQQHHSFDFILSGATSQVIDREFSTHYGGTIEYNYYRRWDKPGKYDINLRLPITFYGFAITDYEKRTSDNTALETIWLQRVGPPFDLFQVKDLNVRVEPRRRDAIALDFKPRVELARLGIRLTLFTFIQQEEVKETSEYAESKSNPLTFREDGVGYKTRFRQLGFELRQDFRLTEDTLFRMGASHIRVRRTYDVAYETTLDAATLAPRQPIARGLLDIISDCGSELSGLTQRYSCRRTARDARSSLWIELEVGRFFVGGSAPGTGEPNRTFDTFTFRISGLRYRIGRDPRTNLFSDDDLNKLIFPAELEILPVPGVGIVQRNNTAAPVNLTRMEYRFDAVYELAGFDFTHTAP